jgi:molybdopterin molybdotransferase
MAEDYDPNSLSVEQALEAMEAEVQPLSGAERLHIRDALGRALAQDIVSPIAVPGYDNSAMDGYALRSADLPPSGHGTLRVVGTAFAGQPFQGTVGSAECVRIMTGAMLPAGADTVVKQEDVQQRAGGMVGEIIVSAGQRPGENVRRAGEDLSAGQVVLCAGRVLTPADIGLMASLGISEAKVRRRARVAFFSTGDELRSLGEPLGPGEIYDSNRYTLHGMLARLGVELLDMGVVRDRREDVEAAFRDGSGASDAIITTGGVSVGEADYVKETLERLGSVSFWKVSMKPGRPLAFGRVGAALFFGLPGNPVSTMVTFYQFVQPALRRLMGQREVQPLRLRVPCLSPLKKARGRLDFQRGILERQPDGRLAVRSTGPQGSAVLSSMSQANCFILLPVEWGNVEPGTEVEVEPFAGLI